MNIPVLVAIAFLIVVGIVFALIFKFIKTSRQDPSFLSDDEKELRPKVRPPTVKINGEIKPMPIAKPVKQQSSEIDPTHLILAGIFHSDSSSRSVQETDNFITESSIETSSSSSYDPSSSGNNSSSGGYEAGGSYSSGDTSGGHSTGSVDIGGDAGGW